MYIVYVCKVGGTARLHCICTTPFLRIYTFLQFRLAWRPRPIPHAKWCLVVSVPLTQLFRSVTTPFIIIIVHNFIWRVWLRNGNNCVNGTASVSARYPYGDVMKNF